VKLFHHDGAVPGGQLRGELVKCLATEVGGAGMDPGQSPITLVLPLTVGMARSTSTSKDTNQRSAVLVTVAARMLAVPCSRRRASFLVDSCVLRLASGRL
jgi:hypothetical protein